MMEPPLGRVLGVAAGGCPAQCAGGGGAQPFHCLLGLIGDAIGVPDCISACITVLMCCSVKDVGYWDQTDFTTTTVCASLRQGLSPALTLYALRLSC
jgi:hypothetical protein